MTSKALLSGTIHISVKKCKGLPSADTFGKSDPYVIVKLDSKDVGRTRTITDNNDPEFYHDFAPLEVDEYFENAIFEVWDEDPMKADDFLGKATVSADVIHKNLNVSEWLKLTAQDGKAGKFGEIQIKILLQKADPNAEPFKVKDSPFPPRSGCRVKLFQDAHVGHDLVSLDLHGKGDALHGIDKNIAEYQHGNTWEEIFFAIHRAKVFIYITGWSVWTKLHLIRRTPPLHPEAKNFANPLEYKMNLGDLLKKKAKEGVRVNLLIWNEATSVKGMKKDGMMGTHDEETADFFKDSGVNVRLAYREGGFLSQNAYIFTHHQKSVILDDAVPGVTSKKDGVEKRRIIAFVGGLDLTDGRWDTPKHPIFRSLVTEHEFDFHQVWKVDQKHGPREPWHDIHSKQEGPICRDVLRNFEQRWRKQVPKDVGLLIDITKVPKYKFLNVVDEQIDSGKDSWTVQFFRSIDSYSAIMENPNTSVEAGIHAAYLHHIKRAKKFIYIENQYFMGSASFWLDNKKDDIECKHLIPVEITNVIIDHIEKRLPFAVYILIPMYPEGIPSDGAVQEMLRWQFKTIEFMYHRIHAALEREGMLGDHKPTDYLNFYHPGQRETIEGSQQIDRSPDRENDHDAHILNTTRRFMIYVHSKMMIVDDEYIILGSANINQRSMGGDRDTEIAVGCYQPAYIADSSKTPKGDVHAFRMALWAEHTRRIDPRFEHPETKECVHFVNAIADKNWQIYTAPDVVDMSTEGHLMKYPVVVDHKGQTEVLTEIVPDSAGAKFAGVESLGLPDRKSVV